MDHYFPTRPSEKSGSERRRAGRVRCESAFCQLGEILDFSRTGVRIRSKRKLKYPSDKYVFLDLQCANTALIVPARQVTCRKRSAGGYDIGFEIPPQSPEWTRALALFAQIAANTDGCLHRRMRAG
jgi:PilZ domain